MKQIVLIKNFQSTLTELYELSNSIKEFWESFGIPNYDLKSSEKQNLRFRRSLYFNKKLLKGTKITINDISRIRPGHGLEIKYLSDVIGLVLNKDVDFGDRVSFDAFE